jgi:hypothetical protein
MDDVKLCPICVDSRYEYDGLLKKFRDDRVHDDNLRACNLILILSFISQRVEAEAKYFSGKERERGREDELHVNKLA